MYRALLITLLFSTTAFACPELSGKYTNCQASDGFLASILKMDISQIEKDGISHYSLLSNGEDQSTNLAADGVVNNYSEIDPETNMLFEMNWKTNCDNDNELVTKQINTFNGFPSAIVTQKFTKVGNQLHINTTTEELTGTINETIICE